MDERMVRNLDCIRTIDISHKASPEQLERCATLYHFRCDPKQMERGPIRKPSGLPSNYTSHRKHEHRIKKDGTVTAKIWTQGSSIGLSGSLSHMEKVLRNKLNLKFKFHTMASQKISRSAWLGKPRSTHKWWSVESKFVDKVLVGEIKMEVERRSLRKWLSKGSRLSSIAPLAKIRVTWWSWNVEWRSLWSKKNKVYVLPWHVKDTSDFSRRGQNL